MKGRLGSLQQRQTSIALESWIVRNRTGEPLGMIRKLILDSRTGRVAYAEMTLARIEIVLRIPWRDLELDRDGIFWDGTMDDIVAFYYVPFRNDPVPSESEGSRRA
jgi:hypothetical protein